MLKDKKKIDFSILLIIIIFATISILTINSASTYISSSMGNLVLKQLIWYGIGIILTFIIMHFKNEYLYRHAYILYIIFCLSLLLLLFFGTPINNSKCWFTIPGIGNFQPSEFMKIVLMLTLSVMINNFRIQYNNPTIRQEALFIFKTLVIVLIPSVLTFMQPDTGAVIMYLVIYFCMMFTSGIRMRWFIICAVLGVLCIGGVMGTYFLNSDLFMKLFGTNLFYRIDRVFNWKSGSGLQLENALASIGSAGLLGHGYNKTPIYFPESGTDFIFAVFASNFGFLGSIFLVSLILIFDIKLIRLINKEILTTDKYTLVGIIGCLVFQQVQNIGMTIGLLPITGITLPFISYGGSSLLSYMLMIGIILNITRDNNSHKYNYKF